MVYSCAKDPILCLVIQRMGIVPCRAWQTIYSLSSIYNLESHQFTRGIVDDVGGVLSFVVLLINKYLLPPSLRPREAVLRHQHQPKLIGHDHEAWENSIFKITCKLVFKLRHESR